MKAPFLLLSVLSAGVAIAQQNIFAVTDLKAGGAAWSNIRETSFKNEGTLILKNQEFNGNRVDMVTQQKRAVSGQSVSQPVDLPMYSGVAALAYDRVHNRLYFSTMFNGDIRYVSTGKDDNTYYQVGKVYSTIPLPNNVPVSANNQGPVITRMTVGADGFVYGMSNDGNGFFRISTSAKKPVIENLGKLADDAANGAMSIHSSCSSWGGDMVASSDGSLYVFSMYQQVFKVNPADKKATWLGKIQGLPADFTVNGAAVDEDGSIILSSSTLPGKYAVINDPTVLNATVKQHPGWYNASDLASGNLLFSKKDAVVFGEFDRSSQQSGVGVYPNPVTNGQIIVHFKDGLAGKHSLDLLDISGAVQQQSVVNLNGEAQRVTLRTGVLAQGIYLLRVTNAQRREVETIKVMIR
jgi:Secretion system C-terminal sorting domain